VKAQPRLPPTITSAASMGPRKRPRLYCAEERLSALSRSSGGTTSASSAEKAGLISAPAQPLSSTTPSTAGTLRWWVKARAASTQASSVCMTVKRAMVRRRSKRSASAPPMGASTLVGKNMAAATAPVHAAEPVAWVT
jgi:hypothetical protein